MLTQSNVLIAPFCGEREGRPQSTPVADRPIKLLGTAGIGYVRIERTGPDEARWSELAGTRVKAAAGIIDATVLRRSDQYFLSFARPIHVDPEAHLVRLTACDGAAVALQDGAYALMPRLHTDPQSHPCMLRSLGTAAAHEVGMKLVAVGER